jgi:hypothetical protein
MKDSELKDGDQVGYMKRIVMCLWTYPLHCNEILWTRRIRIFCDGGCPKFRWIPRLRRQHYATHWGLSGFAIYLWGREVNFSLGVDRKGFYSPRNAKEHTTPRNEA